MPSSLSLVFQLAHALYAVAQWILGRRWTAVTREQPHFVTLLLTLLSWGLVWDNVTRALMPSLLPLEHASLVQGVLYFMVCVSYWLHGTSISGLFVVGQCWIQRFRHAPSPPEDARLWSMEDLHPDTLDSFKTPPLIKSPGSPRALSDASSLRPRKDRDFPWLGAILSTLGFVWGAWDYLVGTQPYRYLTIVYAYGIPLLKYKKPGPPTSATILDFLLENPALILILMSLLMLLGLDIWLGVSGKRAHVESGWKRWRPLLMHVMVVVLYGLLPPTAGSGGQESVRGYLSLLLSNGVEVIFMYGIWCLWDAIVPLPVRD